MPAGKLNLTVEQGSSWSTVLTWKINNVAVNLTGYSARMQVRVTHDAAAKLLDLTVGSGITLGGALGTITIALTDAQTKALLPGKHVYDLELVSAGGQVTRLVEGFAIVPPEVTR